MKSLLKALIFTILSIIISNNIYANTDNISDITIINPWSRATVAKQSSSGIFLSIKSKQNLTLFKIESPLATKCEIHTMIMKNNTMYMHSVDYINIPKDKITNLNGDFHIMLFGLKQKLQVGTKIPLILYFKDENNNIIKYNINANVKPIYYSEK